MRTVSFDSTTRNDLIRAFQFSWRHVSPAIFGSIFQGAVGTVKERREDGVHYTTEDNILKVIGPLFLDDLNAQFLRITELRRGRIQALERFQKHLSQLTFLDPACGCGNFLVITYRELRRLETRVLRELHDSGQLSIDVELISLVNVNQFYGIELSEFPVRIAEVSMWMMDHLMNQELSELGHFTLESL